MHIIVLKPQMNVVLKELAELLLKGLYKLLFHIKVVVIEEDMTSNIGNMLSP